MITATLNQEVQSIINNCQLDGKTIKLPVGQLDREIYEAVADKLKKIGGKWNRSANGFTFKHDPANLLAKLKAGQDVNFQKDYQFFGTPDSLADYLVEYAYLHDESKVWEPHAGHGALIKAVHRQYPDLVVDYCEIAPESQAILADLPNTNFVGPDCLSDEFIGKYTTIVANPPFTKNQDILHVRHLFDCLAEHGTLACIMSRSWITKSTKKETEFRNWLTSQNFYIEYVPAGEFAESGTSVATCIVVIRKTEKPSEHYSDTGATSHAVNDLILFAESTRELYDDLQRIYKNAVNASADYLASQLALYVDKSKRAYISEMPESCPRIQLMTAVQDAEAVQILTNDFENWKLENL